MAQGDRLTRPTSGLAWLILRPGDLVPTAVKVVLPNNDQTLHQFTGISVNHPWTKIFGGNLRPNTPLTWKYIREDPPPSVPERQGPPQGPALQRCIRGSAPRSSMAHSFYAGKQMRVALP